MKIAFAILGGVSAMTAVSVILGPMDIPEPVTVAAPAPEPATEPVPEVTLRSGIHLENQDPAVRPQDDLYRAVNGHWLASTQIPADKSSFGAFTQLADDAETRMRAIVEELAALPTKVPGSIEQKVGDYYAAFMDEAHIETLGLAPVQEDLAAINAVTDVRDLPVLFAALARNGISVPLLPYVHVDPKEPTRYAGDFYQGGLSMPDRDFYLIEDEKFGGIRSAFLAHVGAMMQLAGEPQAPDSAQVILKLETELAKLQWDKVDLRDPVKGYNPYVQAELPGLTTVVDWDTYLKAVGFASLPSVLISQPSYVTGLGKLLQTVPLEQWKTYLRWKLFDTYAEMLPKAFVDEHFAFTGHILNGIQEQRPRWKRGISAVERSLGEAVGQVYVSRHFPEENKHHMEVMVQQLIKAYGLAIDELSWMGAETKAAAREKLAKFSYKIGYPNRWRDYSRLEVIVGDTYGNARRAAQFEYDRDIAKLGGPVDREEWGMTPQTVNAYYNSEKNEIVFPAAILQPPFFDAGAEDAVNYGSIGAVIGHEISHGFDDSGSQYDGDGKLRVWWTADDRARFDALGAQLAAQYDAYEPVSGYHVNGKFTLGENIADLGGLTVAHRAYQLSLDGKPAPVIDGLSADQRFFMGWAQAWRRLYRDENLLNRLKTDPHSPSEYRCNGVVVNVPAFYDAFTVNPGDRLHAAPEARIKIW
ncbi:MAG: M13 family metallopeptidase [Panacagrimonas sp.]